MTTATCALIDNRLIRQLLKRWQIPLCIMLLIAILLNQPIIVAALAGFGGYISEKILGNGTDENLYLGNGTNELAIIGTCPVVSTESASSQSVGGVVSAILKGNLQSLNGMPQASAWFTWGYTPMMVNSTATNIVTATGGQTATINPDAGEKVYYQFYGSTDGVASGDIKSFIAGGGHGLSYWIMRNLLPVVIAASILIAMLVLTGNPVAALIAAVTGVLAFYIIQAIVNIL